MFDEESFRVQGREVTIEPVEPRTSGGARVDVIQGDRTWRVDVTRTGTKDEIVTTWRGDNLANLEEPDWLEDALARLAMVA